MQTNVSMQNRNHPSCQPNIQISQYVTKIRRANGPSACGITWTQSSFFFCRLVGTPLAMKRHPCRTVVTTFSTIGRSRPRVWSISGRTFSDLDFGMDFEQILGGFGSVFGWILEGSGVDYGGWLGSCFCYLPFIWMGVFLCSVLCVLCFGAFWASAVAGSPLCGALDTIL